MTNNYSALKMVAKIFKIISWLTLIAGGLYVIITLYANFSEYYMESGWAILIVIAQIAIYTFLSFIICLAISQFILLCVNVAEKIENMDNNLYVIAKKKEEEIAE